MHSVTANCTCSKCGSTFSQTESKETLEEAYEWQNWAENNIKICPTCYDQMQQEQQQAEETSSEESNKKPKPNGLAITGMIFGLISALLFDILFLFCGLGLIFSSIAVQLPGNKKFAKRAIWLNIIVIAIRIYLLIKHI